MKFKGEDLMWLMLGAAGVYAVYKIINAAPAVASAVGQWWSDTVPGHALSYANQQALTTLNPASDQNAVYTVASAVANEAAALTGGTPDTSLGVRIWEFLHPTEVAAGN